MSHAYREPAPSRPHDYAIVGDALEVAVPGRLPNVCLKCGARRDVGRRSERFATPSSWLAWVGAGLGVSVASALRSAPQLVPYVLVVVVVAALVLVRAAKSTATAVVVRVPLCATCDRRWSEGVVYRKRLVAAVAVLGAIAVLAYVERAMIVARPAGVGLAVLLLVAASLKLRGRFLEPLRVSADRVALRGVAPLALTRLRERLERAELEPVLAETATAAAGEDGARAARPTARSEGEAS